MTFAATEGRGVGDGNSTVMKWLVRIRFHGRSLVFSIPPDVREKLAIKRNDYMHVWAEGGMIHAVKIDLEKLADYSRARAADAAAETKG
jgi:hypothetical protein